MADMSLPRSCTHSRPQTAPELRLTFLGRVFGVWRQRNHLSRLDAHMRRDIGISDGELAREARRPIWDVPATWRL